MNRDKRVRVLEKYGYRCAYCGCTLDIRSMQVDHIVPKAFGGTSDEGNLNPSCRRCNHYKSGNPLEVFREELKKVPVRMRATPQSKLAVAYNMVEYHKWDGVFYYEKEEK